MYPCGSTPGLFALLMHQCQCSASLPQPVLMETVHGGCTFPSSYFFLPHHTNFPDVAATRNQELNEHLSVSDSFSPCEGLSGGCGWEVSLPPWTACNDVKLTIVKKSLLLCSKQQQPASAAPHLEHMWQKGQPGNGFQFHHYFLLMHGRGGSPLKFCVLCQETGGTHFSMSLCHVFPMSTGVGAAERKTWGCFVFLSKGWIM